MLSFTSPDNVTLSMRGDDYMLAAKPIDAQSAYYVMVLNATDDNAFFFGQVRACRGGKWLQRRVWGDVFGWCCALVVFPPADKCTNHIHTHTHTALKQTLLQNLYTEFDTDNRRIGFAPAAADCRKAVGL